MPNSNKSLTFAEIFAGAGGLGEGFIENGFNPVSMIDVNPSCCQTLKTRLAYHYLKECKKLSFYRKYQAGKITSEELYSEVPQEVLDKVSEISINAQNIQKIKKIIQKNADGQPIDVLLGGPPCQAYSAIGKIARNGKKKDERLYYYRLYAKLLEYIKPKVFLFENVPGLLRMHGGALFNSMVREFEKRNYKISYKILDSSNYGVLQKRKRLIVIGRRRGVPFDFDSIRSMNRQSYCVNDLLADLPKLKPGESGDDYPAQPTPYLKKYKIRGAHDTVLVGHQARPHIKRDMIIYKKVIKEWNKNQRRLHYNNLPEKLRTHKTINSFVDRYKVVAGDMAYSHTMLAHIAKDGHYYIHPDIEQNRSLTVREAARIQSFSDDYFFEGSRTAQFNQIGNAVPPLMSSVLAKSIIEIL